MCEAAVYAQEQKLKLVLKPHGGASGASEEILRCLEKVKHPNFKIWFDAGNIIYYTGKDPVEQLKPIAEHVTGFCAKDCAQPKGSVFLQFGAGKVDFAKVFTELKRAGFDGPVMVEGCEQGKHRKRRQSSRGRTASFWKNCLRRSRTFSPRQNDPRAKQVPILLAPPPPPTCRF